MHRSISACGESRAFRQRMERQCHAIERYRLCQLHRGRLLSMDEAALEWIERYAADFAGSNELS